MDSPYLDVQIMATVDASGRSFLGNAKAERPEEEQKFFRRTTANSCVIMAPSVLTAFGRPLPNRVNMVISSEEEHEDTGYMAAENLYEAIRTARMFPSIFVIGDSGLYKEAFEYANTLWLTKCKNSESKGGEKFPKIPKHYTCDEVIELADGIVVEQWVNPDKIIKLYRAPARL